MIQYSLEVGICWLLFYGIYFLLLKKETFFRFNRIYLIGTLCLGLLIPKFTTLGFSNPATENTAIIPTIVQPITVTAQKISYSLETIVVTAESATTFNIWKFIFILWALGAILACARFIYGIFKISKLTYTNKIEQQQGYLLVNTKEKHLPFSFLNILFWSDFYLSEASEKQRILDHELVHIKKAHSLDNIFIALLLIPFWWVLPLYGYQKAIKTVHEYQADEAVTKFTPVPEYGRLLMQYARNGFQIPLTNGFAFTQLKNRIVMMTQEKSNPKKLWKYLTVIPAALVLCVFLANTNAFPTAPTANEILINEINNADPFDRAKIKKELTRLFEADYNDKKSAYANYNKRVKALKLEYPSKTEKIDNLSFEIFKELALLQNKDGYKLTQYEIKNGCFVQTNKISTDQSSVKGDIYKVVDNMPRFSDCQNEEGFEFDCAQKEMLNFIYSNIKYPQEARDKNLQGIVVCRFIVDKNGNVTTPEIVRSLGGGCDEEVLRVVNSFPQWQPGAQGGKKVNVYYNLPVKFKLEDDTPQEETAPEITDNARISGCEDITDKEERNNCSQKLLLTEIYTNIKYPELARENGIEGVSVLRFDVHTDGTIKDPGFKKYIGGNCEEAILTMFEHLQKTTTWIPAKSADGTAVVSEYILPIKFKLQDNDLPEQKIVPLALTAYQLFPNPTHNELTVAFNPKVAQNMELLVFDSMGKQRLSMDLGKVKGNNKYQLNASDWESGMYFIKLVGANETFIDQFQVAK